MKSHKSPDCTDIHRFFIAYDMLKFGSQCFVGFFKLEIKIKVSGDSQ